MSEEDEIKDDVEFTTEKPQKADNTLLMVIITVGLLGLGFYINKKLMESKPEAKKADVESWAPSVRVLDLKKISYVPVIHTEGMVGASTKTLLISEVAGASVYISPLLEIGNVIPEGEILLKLDDADYQTQLTSAKSSLADAELLLAQEQARAVQAEREWKKLGRGGSATDLALRKPQIKSARARIEAAEAQIQKAERDVSKTVIRAPYTCKVDEKFIGSGAFVSSFSRIAEVSSIDKYKVSLPIDLNELRFLGKDLGIGLEVSLESLIGGESYDWLGKAVRFEGGVDSNTFSRMMVVDVERDESKIKGFELPPVGLFIKAKLHGEEIGEVFSIPREAIRENETLWLLSEENTLNSVNADIVRTERDSVLVNIGKLKDGDRIIISPIAIPVAGMQLDVEADNENSSESELKKDMSVKESADEAS